MSKFQKIHREDTSFTSKRLAKKGAIENLKKCEGFMLFTAIKTPDGGINYSGNAFIDKDFAAGMPEFIHKVLDGRKKEFE